MSGHKNVVAAPKRVRKNVVAAPKRVRNKHAEQPSLFGPAPLIEGEDAAAYNEFLAKISSAVKPKDFLEEIWVRDLVDLSWEALRMRRIKARLLKPALSPGFYDYSTTIDSVERIDRMVMNAEARRNATLREIERHRSCMAEALRRATDDVVDAEFEDVARDAPDDEVARDEVDEGPDEHDRGGQYDEDHVA
jgi:hypothetical protein